MCQAERGVELGPAQRRPALCIGLRAKLNSRAAVPSDEIIGAGVSATCSSFVDLIRYWPVSLPQGAFLTGSCTGGIVALAGIVLAR